MPPYRIYIFGASGSGTTTLGADVPRTLHLPHVDTDDHYWVPTDPPFTVKREPEERVASLRRALGHKGWVLSGSCFTWAEAILREATLIVFMTLPAPERLARLKQRERLRFGARIDPGGDMFEVHRNFMDWAAGYDNPDFDGRTLAAHETWLSHQTAPVRRVDGTLPVAETSRSICEGLD